MTLTPRDFAEVAELLGLTLGVEAPPEVAASYKPRFNLPPTDPHHRKMLDGGFVDAWEALNKGKPRRPTFHLYDEEPEMCCDYVFVTPDLVPRLKSIRIDTQTQASDHQPVLLEFK